MEILGYAKLFILSLVIFVAIDGAMLSQVLGGFFNKQLGSLVRKDGDSMKPNVPFALLAWVALVIGIMVFVLPLSVGKPWWHALIYGALFGFVVYGTYEFTNYSILKSWKPMMVLVDISWGCVVCGVNSVIIQNLAKWLLY